jgi:hypothetical protein
VWIVPAINLALLLPQSEPPVKWQVVSGVNLTSRTEETSQALSLQNELRKTGRSATVYSSMNVAAAAFDGVAGYEAAVNPIGPRFSMIYPIDWRRRSTIRLHELLTSEYILFTPIRDPGRRQQSLSQTLVQDFPQENLLFESWLTQLSQEQGVKFVSETSSRLLQIEDVSKLERSLNELVQQHSWSQRFLDANPKHWWTREELLERLKTDPPALASVRFGDMFTVEAISLHRKTDEIILSLWWVPLQGTVGANWYFFCHALDNRGEVIASEEIKLGERRQLSPRAPNQFNSLTILHPGSGKSIKAIGVGIYQRNKEGTVLLPADKGLREWGNRRVIIAVPQQP